MEKPELLTYLALGDSYTIGESVSEKERWPIQLVSAINKDGKLVDSPVIIATTGWTTSELLDGIKSANIESRTYDVVSILIGVNNQYRGYDIKIFEREFQALVVQSIQFAGDRPENVFVVSIPDWGITPFAAERNVDALKVGGEIDEYNRIKKKLCNQYNVRYFDITAISREAGTDTTLLANDGLHPSGSMYGRWVNEILPWFKLNISGNGRTN